jgi:hypothetical protein
MKKMFLLFNRIALMAGLLVALTPCGLCHKASIQASLKGHGCCSQSDTQTPNAHSSRGPLCQIMDQSSLSIETVHLDLPAVVPAVQEGLSAFLVAGIVPFQSVPVFSSPPRSSQVLRI